LPFLLVQKKKGLVSKNFTFLSNVGKFCHQVEASSMKRLQHVVLAAGILGTMLLSSCSQFSVYGTYSFSMGSAKGTHFYVAMVLTDDPSTDSAGAEAGRKAFSFDYANVSSESTDSSSSEESSSSSEESSSVTSESSSTSSSEATSNSGESSSEDSSTTPAVTSSHTFVTDAAGNLKELHVTGDWAYYDPSAPTSSSSASTSASSSEASSSEATSSVESVTNTASSSSASTSNGQRLDLNFFLLPEDTGLSETTIVPFAITRYFLDVSIVGKNAEVVIPVSFSEAISKLLDIILDGKDPDSIKIHTVTITLTKEDKTNL
jgi:hypothetical protein